MRRAPPDRSARGRLPRGQPKGHGEDDEIPEVYREMLAEAELRSPDVSEDRPIKRRKVGTQRATTTDVVSVPHKPLPVEDQSQANRPIQTVYDEPTSEESDMEWEEVDLQQAPAQSIQIAPVTGGDDESLQITLDDHAGKRRKVISRQKPLTAAEKKLRLDIHKVHVLCLLRHVQIRNLWCNDDELQVRKHPLSMSRALFSVCSMLTCNLELSQEDVTQASDRHVKSTRGQTTVQPVYNVCRRAESSQ
jgi:xeroderma pigmentosum group C-complementing protein